MLESLFESMEDVYDNLRGRKKRKAKRKAKKAKRRVKKTKRKTKRKTRRKKIVKKGRKLAKGAVKLAKKTVGKVGMVALKPFMRTIKKVLKKKGVNTSGISDQKAVELFYNKVVVKKPFEGYRGLEALGEDSFAEHPAFSTLMEDADEQDHIAGAAVGVVVDAVIGYFKNKKKKKEAGEKLSADETLVATTAQEVEQALLKKQAGAQPVTQAQNKKTTKFIITGAIIAVVALGAFFVLKKK